MPDAPTSIAKRLFVENVIWDDHAGFGPSPKVDLKKLQIWKDAGVNYLSIDAGYDVMDWREAIKSLAHFRHWIKKTPGYRLVSSVDEVIEAKKAGDLAITFDLEGMNILQEQLSMVELFYDLGVRQMLFAYNKNNAAGGGCHDEDVGLTDFGRQVIQEMNRLGMVVDCSHCAYRTSMEAMELSSAPTIFSHSNARVLWDHERNIRDEQAKACAKTGGVVGVVGIGIFLGNNDTRTSTLADQVMYYADLIGPRHIGIGLDFAFKNDGEENLASFTARARDYWPERQYNYPRIDYVKPHQIFELTEELLRRGMAEGDVVGVLGANFMRVARQVWKPIRA